jgi:hypothetical protein
MDINLAHSEYRKGERLRTCSSAMTHLSTDQGEGHVLAFVQALEGPDPERGRVVRYEQDGPGVGYRRASWRSGAVTGRVGSPAPPARIASS